MSDGVQSKKLRITASNGWRALMKYENTVKRQLPQWHPRTTGKLALLPSLPLDILFEIFGHLSPLDVLHLARTTKAFRRVLMSRSSISIWKAARKNVLGLPDCPASMYEPQYINLAFDQHCHNCLTINVPNVDYRLRVRYCMRCAKICLKSNRDDLDEVVRECIVFTEWQGGASEMYSAKAAKDIKHEYESLPQAAREDYVRRKQAEVEAINEHAELCELWEDDEYDRRMDELDDIRTARQHAILQRLRALGWGDEINRLPVIHDKRFPEVTLFHEHQDVKKPKPLTDRSWQNIEHKMVQYMVAMKQHRLLCQGITRANDNKRIALEVYRSYKRSLANPDADIMPGPADFCEFAPIKRLIEPRDEFTPRDEFMKVVQDELPQLILEWQTTIKSSLRAIMEKDWMYHATWSGSDAPNKPDKIALATSVWCCEKNPCIHWNHEPGRRPKFDGIWYPQVLHHKCNSLAMIPHNQIDATADDPAVKLGSDFPCDFRRQQWSCSKLTFDLKASAVVSKVVKACGSDPFWTTAAAMDEMDPRLVCLKCSFGHKCDGERRVPVRTWRNAVVHCMEKHWGDASIPWERISDADVQTAKKLEVEFQKTWKSPQKPPSAWKCTRCRDTSQETEKESLKDVKKHVRQRHSIRDAEEGEDYYRSPDAPPDQPQTVKMVPAATNYKPFESPSD